MAASRKNRYVRRIVSATGVTR